MSETNDNKPLSGLPIDLRGKRAFIAGVANNNGYGGGMSPAKAALESDTHVLAFKAGRKHKVKVNTISTEPLRSRAAKAIGY